MGDDFILLCERCVDLNFVAQGISRMARSSTADAKKHKPSEPSARWTPRRIVELVAWIVVLAALPFAAQRWWNHPGVLIGLAVFYIVVALSLRSRLIICTLIGVVLGVMFDNGVKSGGLEQQAWEMVWHMIAGLAIGITIGLAWDRGDVEIGQRERRNNASAKRR